MTRALTAKLAGLALALCAVLLCITPTARPRAESLPQHLDDRTFWMLASEFSEPNGTFRSDNLVSNETVFQYVIPTLQQTLGPVSAYIGVGPDQNFTYIAAVRPEIAFIVDIRRDNLLLHLLFKALFTLSSTRVDYLAMLVGRPVPAGLDAWRSATVDRIVAQVEAPPLDARAIDALRAKTDEAIARIGVTLSREDRVTIDRFHRRFIESGVGLQFQSAGRPPQSHYPAYRDLLLAATSTGLKANYLASEEAFQFVRGLQERDLIVPVVGDLSGARALAAIADVLTRKKLRLSALYASNVEFYLFSDGRFQSFAVNLGRLPRTGNSVVIRSVFGRFGWPRGGSVSQLHDLTDMLDGVAKGRYRYYDELINDRR
ncbi:MAG TPA: hypothetical protein VFK57_20865 [Vicinamibacterales bacterium]|nr:hypothetical protein [Vicinamibacterales bacterium]